MRYALPILLLLMEGPAPLVWDFEGDLVAQKPMQFSFDVTDGRSGGRWRVVDDAGNRVLAQLETDGAGRRALTAVVDDQSMKNLRVSARVKSISGEAEHGGGLVWRYRNSENFLAARLDVRRQAVNLYRIVNGNRIRFGGAENVKLEANKWYLLRIEHSGEKIKLYIDDEMICDARDKQFERAGKFGVLTPANAVTWFDDLKATKLKDDDDKDHDRGRGHGDRDR